MLRLSLRARPAFAHRYGTAGKIAPLPMPTDHEIAPIGTNDMSAGRNRLIFLKNLFVSIGVHSWLPQKQP
jgi:hypothetical protein